MLTDAIPYVDEYLAVFTGDEVMQQVQHNMQSILNNTRGRWAAISLRGSARKSSLPGAPTIYHTGGRWTAIPPGVPELKSSLPGASTTYHCRRCNKPVLDAARACPVCGNPSPLAALYPSICAAAIVAGLAAWHFAATQPSWARVFLAIGAALFVFALIGPILFQIGLATLKKKS